MDGEPRADRGGHGSILDDVLEDRKLSGLVEVVQNESCAREYHECDSSKNHAENEPDGWAIWVRDENHLDQAKEELGRFAEDPADARYDGADAAAHTIRQQELQKREAARKSVVAMRGRWNRPALRRRPLAGTLIGLSVLVAMSTSFGDVREGAVMRKLAISDIARSVPGQTKTSNSDARRW